MSRALKKSKNAFAFLLAGVMAFLFAGCGSSLYKVKQRADAPITGANGVEGNGLSVKAAPLLTDEESQELFEANLPLAGLLPIRLEIKNASGAPILFKRVRVYLRDSDNRKWKARSPKQAVSRIMDYYAVYLYNPNSKKGFEEGVRKHAFDLESPLETGHERRGLVFFQTPKKESVETSRGMVLVIEGLPQPIEVIFN